MVGVLLLNFVCAWRAGHATRRFALFASAFFVGYIVLFVTGEFLFLPIAGLNFQGRHLLPAGIGLAGLVMHRVWWARIALIGWLAALNVRLAYESLVRYFGGGLGGLVGVIALMECEVRGSPRVSRLGPVQCARCYARALNAGCQT